MLKEQWTGVVELQQQLAETRRRGYGLAVEEGEAGIVALAVAFRAWDAPDAPIAGTLSVAGPLTRLHRDRYDAIATALARAARDLCALWSVRRRQKRAVQRQLTPGRAGAPRARAERTAKVASR